jgi:F-type H+-transporting ATPase subunit b
MTVLAAEDLFLVPNGTIIAELIAFLIILFILHRYVVPRLQKAMTDRQKMIEDQIEESKQAKERLEAAEKQYKEAMDEARTEAAKIRDDARAQGTAILEDLRRQAQAEQDRIVAQGREQLAAERQQLVAELRSELGRLAVELAGRIVGESLEDEARRAGTVERFLGELDQDQMAESRGSR